MMLFTVVVSFLLDGFLSIYAGMSFLDVLSFKPMFTIVSFVLIAPFFTKYRLHYYKICALVGFVFDLMHSNTLILNTLVFPLLGFAICKLYDSFSDGLSNGVVITAIILTIYHILTYLILVLIGYLPFKILLLSYDFFGILITNVLYFIIFYCIIKLIFLVKKKIPYSL